jgi:hypothetical protein
MQTLVNVGDHPSRQWLFFKLMLAMEMALCLTKPLF